MKLYQAITLSLLCHGILLLPSTEQPLPDVAVAPIQVVLSVNEPKQLHTEKNISRPRLPSNNRQAQTASQAEPATVVNNTALIHPAPLKQHKPVQPNMASDSTARTAKVDASRQHAQTYVISRLHRRIDNYFFYPLLARRNGWEGKVILALDINLGGRIQNVQVKAGSGHAILDRSALDAVSRIPAISDIPQWQGPSLLNIDIPVIYRLQG